MILAAYEALGTPFQYAKFAGGIEVTFVGFQLDYGRCKMGVTARRGPWLLNFIKEMEEARYTVHMRPFWGIPWKTGLLGPSPCLAEGTPGATI